MAAIAYTYETERERARAVVAMYVDDYGSYSLGREHTGVFERHVNEH